MIRLIFLIGTVNALAHINDDYYWREYTGVIPIDAISAGDDISGEEVYIGQALLRPQGLIVSQIFRGKKEVAVAFQGFTKIDLYIKILCGVQKNFYWLNATAAELHVQLLDKRPVIGGNEPAGFLYIGRINHEGTTTIGKVDGFKTGDAKMHFVDKGTEKTTIIYQVLVYNNNFDVRTTVH